MHGVRRRSIVEVELEEFPFTNSEMDASYEKLVAALVSVDDQTMTCLLTLELMKRATTIPMDGLHKWMANRYEKKRTYLNANGFKLGRSRLAALNTDFLTEKHAIFVANAFGVFSGFSLFCSSISLCAPQFNELSGFVVIIYT